MVGQLPYLPHRLRRPCYTLQRRLEHCNPTTVHRKSIDARTNLFALIYCSRSVSIYGACALSFANVTRGKFKSATQILNENENEFSFNIHAQNHATRVFSGPSLESDLDVYSRLTSHFYISYNLCVSERTIPAAVTGDVQPKKQQHGPSKLLGDYEQLVLLRIILENTGIMVKHLQTLF